ncbi:MAG: ABC transporter ATP-binding protein [Verrucomicrobiota bacterium]
MSFSIKRGEVLGIIGHNGAGKSTLLKLLSRITEPTTGHAILRGRVSSLLEVGTGFHPELTGRENVLLNGAILGMTQAEIRTRFDEIVDFAGVEDFIDTPVKRYSSGMRVRLGFAVAAHLDADVLIIDEVLAVGDLQFQRKCIGKMAGVAQSGKTVILVSHQLATVSKLCERVILLDRGKLIGDGQPQEIIDHYINTDKTAKSRYRLSLKGADEKKAFAEEVFVEGLEGNPISMVQCGTPFRVKIRFRIVSPLEHVIIGFGIKTQDEFNVRASWSKPVDLTPGLYEALFEERDIVLSSGCYWMVVGVSSDEVKLHQDRHAGILNVVKTGFAHPSYGHAGTVLNPMKTSIKSLPDTDSRVEERPTVNAI